MQGVMDGIFVNRFSAKLPGHLPVNFLFKNRLRFDSIIATSLWPQFFGSPCTWQHNKMQGVMVFLIAAFLQICRGIFGDVFHKSVKI